LAAYRGGDRVGAEKLALAAYLAGFKPVEPALIRVVVMFAAFRLNDRRSSAEPHCP
jgi:hypothetical protein